MDVSVLICTHNRADDLQKTLSGFRSLNVPGDLRWELIVVDNASTDQTRAVCEAVKESLPLKYLFESKLGKTNALNLGVKEAASELLLLTDDDVDVDANWLMECIRGARAHPEASFFGGRVISRWEKPPPRWFVENMDIIRSNPRVDLGDSELALTRKEDARMIGANLMFRRAVFTTGFWYRNDLGPRGASKTGQTGPEEIELQERLLAGGHTGVYLPKVIVYHRDPPYRMTESYIRHWYKNAGAIRVKVGEVPQTNLMFGAPRYLWLDAITNGLKYLFTRPFGPSRTWLSAECRMSVAWGSIRASREKNLLARK